MSVITSAFLRSLQATDSFYNWSVVDFTLRLTFRSPCRLAERKEEGRTDNAETITRSKYWQWIIQSENPLPRYASGQKVYLSTMYI